MNLPILDIDQTSSEGCAYVQGSTWKRQEYGKAQVEETVPRSFWASFCCTVSGKTQQFYVSPKQIKIPLDQIHALNEMDHFADKIFCGIVIALLEYMFIENYIYL